MSLKYRDSQGNETPVAGLNGTSGELVPSVSVIRTGQINLPATAAGAWNTFEVTFDTPMPDADYQVIMDNSAVAYVHVQAVRYKSAAGFSGILYTRDEITGSNSVIRYTAFKLMTDESRALDESRIAQNTANFALAFSETTSYAVGDYVTYDGVLYKCTTAHTAGVWVAGHFIQVTVGGQLKNTVITKKATSSGINGFYTNDVVEGNETFVDLDSLYTAMPLGSRYTGYVSSDSTLNSAAVPGNRDGIITIVKATGYYGDYAEWHPNSGDIYISNKDGGAWSSWKQVSLS